MNHPGKGFRWRNRNVEAGEPEERNSFLVIQGYFLQGDVAGNRKEGFLFFCLDKGDFYREVHIPEGTLNFIFIGT